VFELESYSGPLKSNARLSQKFKVDKGCQFTTLRNALKARKNILVSAGAGTGKTSFLCSCLDVVAQESSETRLLTIEDADEMVLSFPNRAKLFSNEFVSTDQLLEASLRLAPDRIMVGEVRTGGALLTMLKAWNSGHPGGLSTIHADTAELTMPRIQALLQEVTDTDLSGLVNTTLDLIVRLEKGVNNPVLTEIYDVKEEKLYDYT
jgi:type IV secretion system protein VirB11